MELALKVDNREAVVIASLKTIGCPFLIEQLPIGDFLITLNDEPYALFERKTYADLVASLKDSRFREQKHRMQNSSAVIQGYLIEGSYPKGPLNGIPPTTIDSIIMGLTLRDKYTVLHTSDPAHTAAFLAKMLVKFKEWSSSTSIITAHQDSLIQGSIVKKDGLTVETCYLAQLAQIPGVSLVTARALYAKWPTLVQFLTFVQSADRQTLSELMVNDKRLGNSTAERILNYMYDPTVIPAKIPKKITIRLKTAI